MPLTDAGYEARDFETIRQSIVAKYVARYGQEPTGKHMTFRVKLLAELVHEVEKDLESAVAAGTIHASGRSLDDVLVVGGVQRLDAKPSYAAGVVEAAEGTEIPAGARVECPARETTWRILEGGTVDVTGEMTVQIESVQNGPDVALVGDTFTIVDGVTGWTGFVLTQNARLGRFRQTDAEGRARHQALAGVLGERNTRSLVGHVRALDVRANIEENRTAATVGSLPANSYRLTVEGGDDDEIAAVMALHMPPGIEPVGTVTRTIYVDGQAIGVAFNRETQVEIWIGVEGTKDPTLYPSNGDVLVRDAVLLYVAGLSLGEKVRYLNLSNKISKIPGIDDLTVSLGLSQGTEAVQNLPMMPSQLAVAAPSRISIAITS